MRERDWESRDARERMDQSHAKNGRDDDDDDLEPDVGRVDTGYWMHVGAGRQEGKEVSDLVSTSYTLLG